jgi:AcrR family transcriptional regulator
MKDLRTRRRRDRKQETRDALLRSSSSIAKKNGFETTGVDGFMGAIGMAGGTFYSHFESKEALFAVIMERELKNSWEMLAIRGDSPGVDFDERVRAYLGSAHALHPEDGCALTSLAAEIARATPAVRKSAERGLASLQQNWRACMAGDGEMAWTLLAQCVGAVTLARMVEGEGIRTEILISNLRSVIRAFDASRRARHAVGKPRPVRS